MLKAMFRDYLLFFYREKYGVVKARLLFFLSRKFTV